MIDENQVDDIIARARALGTDCDVVADIVNLIAEVRRLDAVVEVAECLNAARLRLKEAIRLAAEQRVRVTEAEAELEAALEKTFAKQPSRAADGSVVACFAHRTSGT